MQGANDLGVIMNVSKKVKRLQPSQPQHWPEALDILMIKSSIHSHLKNLKGTTLVGSNVIAAHAPQGLAGPRLV